MQRRFGFIGIIAIACAATAHAQIPKEATLLGQKYALSTRSLGGQYANGLSVTLVDDVNKSSSIQFVQGETPEKDRLFVVHPTGADESFRADYFYVLTNSGPNGDFPLASANLTEFFGGSVDINRGGRPSTVTWISDVDTGVKKDRNILLTTFTGDDHSRFYDLDTLTGDYIADALLSKIQRCINADEGDPGMPACGFSAATVLPSGNLLMMGRGEGDGPQIGVMDPKQDKFFNALTNLGKVTADQAIQYDIALDPMDIERVGEDEYLVLSVDPAGLGGDRTRVFLHRMKITLPADLTKAEPESIKVQLLAADEILNDSGKDVLGVGVGGLNGMAVGRANANGARILYLTNRDGVLITATPQ